MTKITDNKRTSFYCPYYTDCVKSNKVDIKLLEMQGEHFKLSRS